MSITPHRESPQYLSLEEFTCTDFEVQTIGLATAAILRRNCTVINDAVRQEWIAWYEALSPDLSADQIAATVARTKPCCSGEFDAAFPFGLNQSELIRLSLYTRALDDQRRSQPDLNLTRLFERPDYISTILASWLNTTVADDDNLFQLIISRGDHLMGVT